MSNRNDIAVLFGDTHYPHHNKKAIEVVCRSIEYLNPRLVVHTGDLIDGDQFSAHAPTFGKKETAYEDDLKQANGLLDRVQDSTDMTVVVGGNHEDRIERAAARTPEIRGTYSMLSPNIKLSKNRKSFKFIPYGPHNGSHYPHYAINERVKVVHGWSYGKYATWKHLDIGNGKTIAHGHGHGLAQVYAPDLWHPSRVIQAVGCGCTCKLRPWYPMPSPVRWVAGFVVIYIGRRSETIYSVPIIGDRCILPDGKEIKAST